MIIFIYLFIIHLFLKIRISESSPMKNKKRIIIKNRIKE